LAYYFEPDIYSKRNIMKLKMTISQFKEILNNVNPKFPITILLSGIDQAEREELTQLLRKTKRG
jgi:hypothetical protein